jgi:hypothetical protein
MVRAKNRLAIVMGLFSFVVGFVCAPGRDISLLWSVRGSTAPVTLHSDRIMEAASRLRGGFLRAGGDLKRAGIWSGGGV